MRLFCWYCHKSVSSELPNDALFRAVAVCPECIEKSSEAKDHPQKDKHEDYCLWIPVDDPDTSVWASQCGNEFILEEGTPKGNGFIYCPYCGEVLKEEQT